MKACRSSSSAHVDGRHDHVYDTTTPSSLRLVLFHDRLANDFLDAGDAVVDGEQTALAERAHAALFGFVAEDLGAGVLDDQIAHLVIEQHDLVDALAAAVAGVVALLA